MLQFSCPGCGKTLEAPEERAGSQVACVYCRQPVVVPTPAPPERIVVEEATPADPFANMVDTDAGANYDPSAALPSRFDISEGQHAEVQRLGRVEGTYEANQGRMVLLMALALFLGPVGLLMFQSFLWLGVRMGGGVTSCFTLLIALVCLTMAGFAVRFLYQPYGLRVIVFQKGLWHNLRGQVTIFPWDEVVAVYADVEQVLRTASRPTVTTATPSTAETAPPWS